MTTNTGSKDNSLNILAKIQRAEEAAKKLIQAAEEESQKKFEIEKSKMIKERDDDLNNRKTAASNALKQYRDGALKRSKELMQDLESKLGNIKNVGENNLSKGVDLIIGRFEHTLNS